MPVRIDSARFPNRVEYSASEMRAFGEEAIVVMFLRWDRAHDNSDSPAPPIKTKDYAARKRRARVPDIRNLMLTGKMRRDIQVIAAHSNYATIGAVEKKQEEKIYFNQRRSRMFGMSPKDWEKMMIWFRNLPSRLKWNGSSLKAA